MKITEDLLCAVSFGFPLQKPSEEIPGVLWFLSGHAQGPPVIRVLLTLDGKFTAVGICFLPQNCLSVSWVAVLCSVTWSLSLHVAHTCILWHKNVAATHFFSVVRNLQSRCNVNLPKVTSHCASSSFVLNRKICKQIKRWRSEGCIWSPEIHCLQTQLHLPQAYEMVTVFPSWGSWAFKYWCFFSSKVWSYFDCRLKNAIKHGSVLITWHLNLFGKY